MQLNTNKVSSLEINELQVGQRIDNFLLKQLKGVPKSHIYRLLRSGQIRVNSGRKKPHYKLCAGDKIRLPPIRTTTTEQNPIPEGVLKRLKQAIIYEDDQLIALNKPSGIAVHKGSGLNFGVIECFRQIRPEQSLELVHRLDRETSGCLLLTKNRLILAELHRFFRHESSLQIKKSYLALVCGHWSASKRTVDVALSKTQRGGEHMMQVDQQGDRAISHFELIENFKLADNFKVSLLRVQIETGRTHQIRVHALHCNHPLIGDSKYGDKSYNKFFRQLGLKRLFLHAQDLHLPLTDPISLHAPLSDDLTSLLQKLRKGNNHL